MTVDPLPSLRKQFHYYKLLGEQTFAQLNDEQVNYRINEESNSIASIVKHLHGNMLSRWTDCLVTDGEKADRNRDTEFIDEKLSVEQINAKWQAGWQCFFSALDSFVEADLAREIFIRNQGLTLLDALNRQLAHYPYHVGQIVFIGKMLCGSGWKSMSIPRGESEAYNNEKFSQVPHHEHFTDQYLNKMNSDSNNDGSAGES